MGGIAGSQTLTIVIRGLALGQIGAANFGALVSRELLVGLINSLVWAGVVGLVAGLWFGGPGLALVAGAALAINLVCAALSGAGIPMLLKRLNIDPALAGGVILTTGDRRGRVLRPARPRSVVPGGLNAPPYRPGRFEGVSGRSEREVSRNRGRRRAASATA